VSDAWIFLSIGDSGGCAQWVPLDALIRAADSNNHAIPTIAELEDSVSKLAAAGLVETDGPQTRLTPLGCEAHRAADRAGVGHIQRMFDLSEDWKAQGYPPAAPKSWWLEPATYRDACSSYHAWFQDAYARLKAQRDGTPHG
jgi:hypothetical protein